MKSCFALLIILFFSTAPARQIAADLENIEIDSSFKIENFTETSIKNRWKDASGRVLQVTYEKFEEATAKKLLKNRLIQLKLLFAPQKAPYPGMITKDVSCQASGQFAKEYEETKNSLFWYSEIPGTEDLTFGACGSRKDIYWSQYLLIYCKSQNILYDLRFFEPLNLSEKKFGRPLAKCRK